jgi:hypothetical protein
MAANQALLALVLPTEKLLQEVQVRGCQVLHLPRQRLG